MQIWLGVLQSKESQKIPVIRFPAGRRSLKRRYDSLLRRGIQVAVGHEIPEKKLPLQFSALHTIDARLTSGRFSTNLRTDWRMSSTIQGFRAVTGLVGSGRAFLTAQRQTAAMDGNSRHKNLASNLAEASSLPKTYWASYHSYHSTLLWLLHHRKLAAHREDNLSATSSSIQTHVHSIMRFRDVLKPCRTRVEAGSKSQSHGNMHRRLSRTDARPDQATPVCAPKQHLRVMPRVLLM